MELNFPIKELVNEINKLRKDKLDKLTAIIEHFRLKFINSLELLNSSKDVIELLRKDKIITVETYSMRLTCLVNMAVIYFYGQYEGLTRKLFKKIEKYNVKMWSVDFDEKYPTFDSITRELMREKYNIRIPPHIFSEINRCRKARNEIVHNGVDVPPSIEIVETFFESFIGYLDFMRYEILPDIII